MRGGREGKREGGGKEEGGEGKREGTLAHHSSANYLQQECQHTWLIVLIAINILLLLLIFILIREIPFRTIFIREVQQVWWANVSQGKANSMVLGRMRLDS